MKWTVLGCQAPFPGAGGATSGYLLEVQGKRILIDCGSGVLSQLAEWIMPYELDAVILSHLHHDHFSDFFVLQYAIMTGINLKQRFQPLSVWAPNEPTDWFNKLRYNQFIELNFINSGAFIQFADSLTFSFYLTDHEVPCYAMNISDGKHTILYGADSGPNTNWGQMVKEPDLFICEASFLHKDLPDRATGHLSARQAAEVGNKIKAKQLMLTHLYPEYDLDLIYNEAAVCFSNKVWVASTGLSIKL